MIVPDKCYALNNITINPKTKKGKIIRIEVFETGYYPCMGTATQEEIDSMNDELGVSKTQARAMETASMFGWACYKSCLDAYEKKELENIE